MIEQQWLVVNWHRLCWVRGCDWLDFTSAALAGGEDVDSMFGSLRLGAELILLS